MALTIAVGFVVDDAIVMLENITRYIEEGESAACGGVQGRRRNRLHDRVDQRLAGRGADPAAADGRIIGRLFREFAVTLAMAIFVSLIVSLTLTPMMASRFLRAAQARCNTAGFISGASALSTRMLHAYERGLDLALRWQLDDAAGFLRDAGAVGLSVHHHSQRVSSRSRTPA